MRSINNWIKSVWKDPVWSKVISAGIIGGLIWLGNLFSVIRDILLYQIDLWLVLIFVIVTFFVSKYYSSDRQKKVEQDNKRKVIDAKNAEIQKEHKDKVWRAFNGLEESDLILLNNIYLMPLSDPDNKAARMVTQLELSIYNKPIEKTNIYSGDRSYLPCIWIDYIGDKAHLTFDDYFYKLLENYSNTNEKKKL